MRFLLLVCLALPLVSAVGDPKKVTRYALELEWRPSYCMLTYCAANWKVNEFAVVALRTHGRSAEETENCICDETVASLRPDTKELLAKYFPAKEEGGDNEALWEKQWNQFGCCMESRDRPNRYFKRAVDMFRALEVLEKLHERDIFPGGMVNTTEFRSAFSHKISLSCTFNTLTSIRLFYNLAFDLIDAHEEKHDEGCGDSFAFSKLSAARAISDL